MLKNDLLDRTWFFDLEWVPDAAGARQLLDLPPDTTELEAMNALWDYTGRSETAQRPFVKYLFSRVVSIAFLSRNIVFRDGERQVDFALYSLPKLPLNGDAADEAKIIALFLHYIGERSPHLVGFNSAESDLQVLIQRGLVHQITAEQFCVRPSKPWEGRDYFYRYGEEHLDLLKLFSSGNMKPKLNELARVCGFPGKIDVDGDQVVDLWLNGELTKIVEYNQIDALNTYLIWLRLVHFCGKLAEADYLREQTRFRDFLERQAEDTDKGHIKRFLNKWQM